MSDQFLSSDDYDERAHQLYNEGRYDEALEALREGLALYPHAIELHVGMGYARLAREENEALKVRIAALEAKADRSGKKAKDSTVA